ncbi:N(alpha)-acetyltransferase 30 A [Cochliomyia hominivorax]
MEHIKGSLGSQMQQQQQQQQQQNQSKKKSKNKKKSSKNETNTTVTRSFEEQEEVQQQQQQTTHEGVVLVENGLTDQLKQQLHIGKDNLTSSSCSSKTTTNNSSSSNNNKVNGLMTENSKKSKACPNTTTTTTTSSNNSSCQDTQQPALNGHHEDKEESSTNGEEICCLAVTKKSKRKPNNKKNPNSATSSEQQQKLENGHCPEEGDAKTTNGFSHKETQMLANETNHNTAMTTTTTPTTINTPTPSTTSCNNSNKTTEKDHEKCDEPVTLSKTPTEAPKELDLSNVHIEYKEYESELQMHDIMRLIQAELSEPYSIYTYRYFIYNWPQLCFLAAHGNEYVGAIVCKLDMHMNVKRGYIAMLAVRKEYRKLKIGTTLVQKAIEAMLADKADEVVLETEMSNLPALRLYENLGFVRDKRLFRYYLNGVDALRLKLWFR